jgi:hypothetical protein
MAPTFAPLPAISVLEHNIHGSNVHYSQNCFGLPQFYVVHRQDDFLRWFEDLHVETS